jgi:L-ribulose-5-phosphate 3-epimerase
MNRRHLLTSAPALLAAGRLRGADTLSPTTPVVKAYKNRIGVSTYSFWHFDEGSEKWRPIEKCLEAAADMGFDGVEILQVQMTDTTPAALRNIKSRAFSLGLDLMGFSTHQTFLTPDPDKRADNILKTTELLEQAYDLGIPTMRVNTGRWGTSKNFDELMKNRGIEPRLEGYTDDDGFKWVIDSFQKLAPEAEKRGVTMGLENHWGLGISAEGVMRVVDAVKSPWLQVTLDTGNFLEDPYDRLKKLAPHTVLMQAKTYYGGGLWYSLDLDYARIASIMRESGYRGYISLEMEGKEDPLTAVPKSLEVLRKHFS